MKMFLSGLLARWREWREYCAIRNLLYLAVDVMLEHADGQFRESLIADERDQLSHQFARWLTEDDDRLWGIVKDPMRTIHLFLSDGIR